MPKPLTLRPAEGTLDLMRADLDVVDEKVHQMRNTGYNAPGILREAADAGVEPAAARAAVSAIADGHAAARALLAQAVKELRRVEVAQARLVDLITEARSGR